MKNHIWEFVIEKYLQSAKQPEVRKIDITDNPSCRVRVIRRKPDKIKIFTLYRDVLDQTKKSLSEAGQMGQEGLVFWAGKIEGEEARITRCISPNVKSTRISATINEKELLEILNLLRISGEFLFAQIHSHPEEAFHSHTDDREAISFKKGFISIVVPHLGSVNMENLFQCKVFEYEGNGFWRMLRFGEVQRRFIIT